MKIFTSPFKGFIKGDTLQLFKRHKSLNSKYEFGGTLIFTSTNDEFEPWVIAQWLCEGTNEEPLIALNPAFIHPFVAAWKISSLANLYKRSISINYVTGASFSELSKIGKLPNKQKRYDQLTEHIEIVKLLLSSNEPVFFDGEYYQIDNAKLNGKIEQEVSFFIAGESVFAKEAAIKSTANRLVMINPSFDFDQSINSVSIALIIEEDGVEALNRAKKYFEANSFEKGFFQFVKNNTDSDWKKRMINELNEISDEGYTTSSLLKFGETPFLVGSKSYIKEKLMALNEKNIDNLIVTLIDEKDYAMLVQIKNELNW